MSIEVRHLQKRFGQTVVCDDLSLDIPAGQLVALLGPSGSRKRQVVRPVRWYDIRPRLTRRLAARGWASALATARFSILER